MTPEESTALRREFAEKIMGWTWVQWSPAEETKALELPRFRRPGLLGKRWLLACQSAKHIANGALPCQEPGSPMSTIVPADMARPVHDFPYDDWFSFSAIPEIVERLWLLGWFVRITGPYPGRPSIWSVSVLQWAGVGSASAAAESAGEAMVRAALEAQQNWPIHMGASILKLGPGHFRNFIYDRDLNVRGYTEQSPSAEGSPRTISNFFPVEDLSAATKGQVEP